MDKVVVLTGPTAIGKTQISLDIAKHFKTEIINADASQFRRGLNIGTAKIDLDSVDVVHHLIDIIEIEENFSIKDYQTLARQKITEFKNKGILPFLVGGSGLYINSVIYNYELTDTERDYKFEEEKYNSYNNEELHKFLEKLDFEASKTIHPNNRRRVLRAIERAKIGEKISSFNQGNQLVYDALVIELTTDREVLYDRINQRFNVMIEEGWLKEVEELKRNNIDLTKIKDIGYKELGLYLEGKYEFEEVSELIKKQTRNLAKRQLTWFRNKMATTKVNVDYTNPSHTTNEIIKLISDFLNK
ncbi:MAG TPA: tRNA (adenosine(37)-N6)-dimethylallyltransferase MiaA [Acholeplasmataceae bacterium]|nr:tRNA (adenosine(37)-N6)-dimethylallyltransferase MiaA [Acholeplasmataceae bacterium]